jgi:hypothetical protein
VAEREWKAGLKPTEPQQPCDHGLFGDEAKQLDLPMARKPARLLSDWVTDAEIEALGQRARERAEYFRKAFAHLRPKVS